MLQCTPEGPAAVHYRKDRCCTVLSRRVTLQCTTAEGHAAVHTRRATAAGVCRFFHRTVVGNPFDLYHAASLPAGTHMPTQTHHQTYVPCTGTRSVAHTATMLQSFLASPLASALRKSSAATGLTFSKAALRRTSRGTYNHHPWTEYTHHLFRNIEQVPHHLQKTIWRIDKCASCRICPSS